MDRPTLEQKEVVKSIDIPSFVTTPREVDLDAETMAILNNVPGNVEIENQNHLNELENVARNYREEEWKRILKKAPHILMFEELKRRMSALTEYRQALTDADGIMKGIDL